MMRCRYIVMGCCCCLLQFLFTACNSDIFVKEYLEGDQQVTLNTADSVVIPFKDKNWDIEGIFLVGEMQGDIYDAEGNLIHRDTPLRGDKLKGLVRLEVGIDKSYFSFRVERPDWKSLKIVAGPNMNELPTDIKIWLNNGFDRKQILLTFNPSERYEVDRIEYHWDCFCKEKEVVKVRRMAFSNLSSEPAQWVVYPFEDVSRYVIVTTEVDDDRFEIGSLFGTPPPEVETFNVVEGRPEPSGCRFPVDGVPHSIDSSLTERVTDTVTVPPYTAGGIQIKIYREITVLPYTLYGIHKATGFRKEYKGLIRNSNPVRYEIINQFEPIKTDEKGGRRG